MMELFMKNENKKLPLILDIKGNSLDDGPGIRSVVFFKGCPLSCLWCHNPESQKPDSEISFDGNLCVDCGACRNACPEQALSKAHPFYVDRSRCSLCFLCTGVCPSGALAPVGKIMTVEQILEQILPDQPFFDVSGGGVTLSGGEATLYMDFVSDLARELKKKGIHILLETCGRFDLSRFMDRLYPYVDTLYYDLKLMDSNAHQRYCGQPNEGILRNFRVLSRTAAGDGKTLLARTPLIPGITDTDENITAVASFLKELGVTQGALLPYNPLWQEKNRKMGLVDPLEEHRRLADFSDRAVLERCGKIWTDAGISCDFR